MYLAEKVSSNAYHIYHTFDLLIILVFLFNYVVNTLFIDLSRYPDFIEDDIDSKYSFARLSACNSHQLWVVSLGALYCMKSTIIA